MKRLLLYIALTIFIYGNSFAEPGYPKLIKVWFAEKNSHLRISLLFDKQVEYNSHLENGIIELRLKKMIFGKEFPGSEFKITSTCATNMIINRESNGDVLVKIKVNDKIDFYTSFLNDSKILLIELYSPDQLKANENEYYQALKMQLSGKNDEALKSYRKLISQDYKNPEMYYYIGLLRDTLGYTYQAKSNYQTCISSNMDFPDPYARLASVYEKLNQKEQSSLEFKHYKESLEKIAKITIDTNIAHIMTNANNLMQSDTILLALENKKDSSKQTSGNVVFKTGESKIVRSETINNNTQLYAILANVIVVLVALCSIAAIWILIKRGNKKRNGKKEEKKKELKNSINKKENINHSNLKDNDDFIQKKAQFSDFIKAYNVSKGEEKKEKNGVKEGKQKNNSEQITKNNEISESDEIERLAKKYQVEKEKIELALKLIARNDTESTKEKYLLLIKMLKENMSIEDLAQKLRIPKGEISLIANLKHL
jgi:hypothetical protein